MASLTKFGNLIKSKILDTKTFWKLHLWWGIRKARKERLAREARRANLKPTTTEEYWDGIHH